MTDTATPTILIRMPNWLGDSIMAMPAVQQLARALPGAKLFLAGREQFRQFFRDQPGVTGFVSAPNSGLRPLLSGLAGAKRSLRDAGAAAPDLGLLFTNSFSTAAWLWRTGVRRRLGFATDARRLFLTHPVTRGDRENSLHFVMYYLHLAAQAESVLTGKPPAPPAGVQPLPAVRIGDAARSAACDILRSAGVTGDYAVIAPASAYGPVKDWPPGHYRQLVQRISRNLRLPVVVTGAAAQREVCDSIASGIPGVVSLAGRTGMNEFAGLVAGADLFVGGDSGGAHLAAALGCPTVVIFGITNPSRTRPTGRRVRWIGAGRDRDVSLATAGARRAAAEALSGISPDSVMEAVDETMYDE